MLLALPGAAILGNAAAAGAADPIDYTTKCRECAGSGVVPCESQRAPRNRHVQ